MKIITQMIVVATALLAGYAFATDMDHKAKTIRTVATRHAGTAEITCNETRGWSLEGKGSGTSEYVRVNMSLVVSGR